MSTTAKDNTSEMRIKRMITHDNAWITHDNAWITHDNTHITHGNASITRDNALLLPRFFSRIAVVTIFMSIFCCVNFIVSNLLWFSTSSSALAWAPGVNTWTHHNTNVTHGNAWIRRDNAMLLSGFCYPESIFHR